MFTSIIYTCSVAHASTNFPQYDEYAFPPNYPASMNGVPPKDKVFYHLASATKVGFDNVGENIFFFLWNIKFVSCDLQTSLTEADILYTLPDKKTTLDVMTVTKILSDRGTKSLGDFEVQYIFDPDAKRIVQE